MYYTHFNVYHNCAERKELPLFTNPSIPYFDKKRARNFKGKQRATPYPLSVTTPQEFGENEFDVEDTFPIDGAIDNDQTGANVTLQLRQLSCDVNIEQKTENAF